MIKKALYFALAVGVLAAVPLTAGAKKSPEGNYGVTEPKPIPAEEQVAPLKIDFSQLPTPFVDREKDEQIAAQYNGDFYSEHFTPPTPIGEESRFTAEQTMLP